MKTETYTGGGLYIMSNKNLETGTRGGSAKIAIVKNLDRKFGQVSEDEGYIRVIPDAGPPALFTKSEWESGTDRAEKHPEDVLDLESAVSWWSRIFG